METRHLGEAGSTRHAADQPAHTLTIRGAPSRRHATRGLATLAVLAVLLAACGAPAGTPAAEADGAASPSASQDYTDALFAYDADARLDLTDVGTVEELGRAIRDVTYASPKGGDVLAYIAEPTEDPAGVGILMTPGLPEKRHAYLDPISRFACAGATAMVVEAPWARLEGRGGDTALTFTPQDYDEQIQLIVDLRRAVDILDDMGAEKIGFDAISYGAANGAILAGVEDRIDAYALLSGGSGLIGRFVSERGAAVYPLALKSPAEQQKWIEAMEPLQPIHFVGDATAPILFVAGRNDPSTTPERVEAVYAAAGDTAELRWYDAGHDLNPQAFNEHLEWLADKVGLDRERVASCFEGAF